VNGPVPFALAAVPSVPTGPRSLTLHLEICRLQAELEGLEARIGQFRATPSSPGDGDVVDGLPDRGEELVARMVASLHEAGRAEIDTDASRHRREAQARLDDARSRAADIVDAARADLAVALADRGRAVDTAWSDGLDVATLADRHMVVEAVVPAVDRVVHVEPVSVPVPAAAMPVAAVLASAVHAEEVRTDAAFDAWMAVAPGTETVGDGSDPVDARHQDELGVDGEERSLRAPRSPRSRWLLPLEVAGALLVAALLVVLALVFIG
jgi:hypothetical protein